MANDQHDVERIVRDYAAMVGGALRRLGVDEASLDDATQEVFLVLARRFSEYDRGRSVASWLWGIARGVASTHRRGRRRRERLRAAAAVEPRFERPSAEELVERREARAMLRTFLASLDEDKCAVFVLAELEHRTGPEIAACLDLNLNTVYARLRAARRRFDEAVDRHRRLYVASSWLGLRPVYAKVLSASLTTVCAGAVAIPAGAVLRDAEPAHVLATPSFSNARIAAGAAKVEAERETTPMPKMLQTLTFATAMSVSTTALAKPPVDSKPPTNDQSADEAALVADLETREYIFGNESISGEIHAPSGENLVARTRVHHESLIRIRGHFISELITLATDI